MVDPFLYPFHSGSGFDRDIHDTHLSNQPTADTHHYNTPTISAPNTAPDQDWKFILITATCSARVIANLAGQTFTTY
jgi:hypothetical protein